MWYHAIAYYGTKKRTWWNMTKDDLAEEVVRPFVSKQVQLLRRKGVESVFNFAASDYLTILKSKEKLQPAKPGQTPAELSETAFLKAHVATDEFLADLKAAKSSHNERSVIQQALASPQNKLFVVMKFGDATLDSAYEGVYKPIGLAAGFEKVVRVDEIQDSGNIGQQVLENIATSRVIIADLTGERPNCYYEAGYAHALGKPMIFTIREGDKIHFDLAAYRFIVWDTEATLRKKLKARLEAMNESSTASSE